MLTTVGVTEKKTHSSSLEEHEAELVRKHLRSRSEAGSTTARASRSATAHAEDEIKTKIDLSHISRPGDVLRAITQQKEAAEHPPTRPVAKPPAAKPVVAAPPIEAKEAAPAAPAKPLPPKPVAEPPAPRSGDTRFCGRDAPAGGGRNSAESSRDSPGYGGYHPRHHPQFPRRAQHRLRLRVPPRVATPATPPAASVPPSAPPHRGYISRMRREVRRLQSPTPSKPAAPPPRMIMPQTGPRPVYKAPTPAPGAPPRGVPGRPVPGQPIFQRTARPAAPGARPPLRPGERRPMHPTRVAPAGARPLGVGPGAGAMPPPGPTRPGSRPGAPSRRPGQRYVPRGVKEGPMKGYTPPPRMTISNEPVADHQEHHDHRGNFGEGSG